MNQALRDELLQMVDEDGRVRSELLAEGKLFDGYPERWAAVHRLHGARLREIVDEHGWPGRSLVGDDGAKAASHVLKHAISDPDLHYRCLPLMQAAAAAGEIPADQPALILDGIRFFEGRPLVYGVQFDWDENGEMSPLPIEDEERVDERRAAVGLPPLAQQTRMIRERVAREEHPPSDLQARRREMDEWARSAGWRA
jgi:hypothetical protein